MQKICIIVPCFNEEDRMPVGEFERYILSNQDIYFLFVNDGSVDQTQQVLQRISRAGDGRCRILSLQKNMGKAEAVRQGINKAIDWEHFDYVGYFDADLATPLNQINYMIGQTDHRTYHLIMGIRVARLGAQIQRKSFRHFTGRLFATIISIMLKIPVYDSQCGAKVFSVAVARRIFRDKFISRWLFDVEVLSRAIQCLGKTKFNASVIEIPLQKWVEKGSSKIKASYFLKVPYDLLCIYLFSLKTKKVEIFKEDANPVLTG